LKSMPCQGESKLHNQQQSIDTPVSVVLVRPTLDNSDY
jgi:hypothetical protein